jgi:hypothetical protein
MAVETINGGLKVIYGPLCDCFAISFCLREAKKKNVFHFTQKFVNHKELSSRLILLSFSLLNRNQSTSRNTAAQRLPDQRMWMRKTMMRKLRQQTLTRRENIFNNGKSTFERTGTQRTGK